MSDCCTPNGAIGTCAVPATQQGSSTQIVTNCPICGAKGGPVDPITVQAMLNLSLRVLRATGYRFCRTQECPVVYFSNDGEQIIHETDLRERVHNKAPDAQDVFVCYCFRHTPASIRAELWDTGGSTVVDDITEGVQTGQCACEVRNPQGSCCLGNVRAVVKRLESEIELLAAP